LHEDATVPVSKVADMLVRVQEIAREHGVLIATFGHAGDGNLHPVILFDERDPDEARRAMEAAEAIFKAALALGGTLTGEHGIGLSKARFFALEHGPVELKVLKAIKAALDPNGILNPGKIWGD
ncbi:glycolate oxidase subunit GlcD, partial [Candidatus Bathyarchaeota archaeon]